MMVISKQDISIRIVNQNSK